MMPHLTSKSTKLRPWSGDRAPASRGLGDGQAIPWEYALAPESRDIVRLKERYGLFIDGREVQASDGAVFATINPATEEKLADVARATTAEVDRAIRAAGRAQKQSWGNLPGRERAKYLFRIARLPTLFTNVAQSHRIGREENSSGASASSRPCRSRRPWPRAWHEGP